jgi:hypothetical protein
MSQFNLGNIGGFVPPADGSFRFDQEGQSIEELMKGGKSGAAKSAGGVGAGLASKALGSVMPHNSVTGDIGRIGLSAGTGALTGGPVGAALGGGTEMLSALMGGKEGQQQKTPVPTMTPQMGKIGGIYG